MQIRLRKTERVLLCEGESADMEEKSLKKSGMLASRHSVQTKLIGIITHAHGIEEAVPVVLKFTNNGGCSTITGPGVTQKSADSLEK